MRPENATAVVTGAARGIGAASALQLAQDGWNVAVNYRSDQAGADAVVAQIREAGGNATAFGADVLDDAAWDEALPRVADELGPVLALVNNAGITADGLALQLSDEDWDSVVATNLTAAFRLSRRALRPMIRARFGRVVNLASVVGPRANAGQANYAASKAGLIGLTKTIAHEVARRGVTVNAVALPPAARMRSTTVSAPAWSERKFTPTFQPSCASCSADAAPMPRAAPVTTTVAPSGLMRSPTPGARPTR